MWAWTIFHPASTGLICDRTYRTSSVGKSRAYAIRTLPVEQKYLSPEGSRYTIELCALLLWAVLPLSVLPTGYYRSKTHNRDLTSHEQQIKVNLHSTVGQEPARAFSSRENWRQRPKIHAVWPGKKQQKANGRKFSQSWWHKPKHKDRCQRYRVCILVIAHSSQQTCCLPCTLWRHGAGMARQGNKPYKDDECIFHVCAPLFYHPIAGVWRVRKFCITTALKDLVSSSQEFAALCVSKRIF